LEKVQNRKIPLREIGGFWGMAFRASIFDGLLEFSSWKELQKLAKHATKPIHRSSLDGLVDFWRNQFTPFLREDLFS
jgi:hypothetical protein